LGLRLQIWRQRKDLTLYLFFRYWKSAIMHTKTHTEIALYFIKFGLLFIYNLRLKENKESELLRRPSCVHHTYKKVINRRMSENSCNNPFQNFAKPDLTLPASASVKRPLEITFPPAVTIRTYFYCYFMGVDVKKTMNCESVWRVKKQLWLDLNLHFQMSENKTKKLKITWNTSVRRVDHAIAHTLQIIHTLYPETNSLTNFYTGKKNICDHYTLTAPKTVIWDCTEKLTLQLHNYPILSK